MPEPPSHPSLSPQPPAPPPPQSGNAVVFAPGVWIAPANLRFAFSRSSGPGGQAVNKLSTRAELRVAVRDIHGMDDHAAARLRASAGRRLTQEDEIIIQAETYRSQLDNKQACLDRLDSMVKQALIRPKKRRKTKLSRSMIEKRLESKRRQSQKKSGRGDRRVRDGD
jgi:ribosome-associated protein